MVPFCGVEKMKTETQYCVVYRTGGRENFSWNRSVAMTREQAKTTADTTERMGYPVHIENYNRSLTIGLPSGYAYETGKEMPYGC